MTDETHPRIEELSEEDLEEISKRARHLSHQGRFNEIRQQAADILRLVSEVRALRARY